MTAPLYICRSCRGIPEAHQTKSANGLSWTVCCTRCDRRITSTTSYDDAKDRWNGPDKPIEITRAKLKFSHNKRSKVDGGN